MPAASAAAISAGTDSSSAATGAPAATQDFHARADRVALIGAMGGSDGMYVAKDGFQLNEITRLLRIQYFKNSVYYETTGFGKPEACSA